MNNKSELQSLYEDIVTDYSKLKKDTNKKYANIHTAIDSSLSTITNLISLLSNKSDYDSQLWLSSQIFIEPIKLISLSKHTKLYYSSWFILKKLIEYSFINPKESEITTKIIYNIFIKSDSYVLKLKCIDISLTLINSLCFDWTSLDSINNILWINFKAFVDKIDNCINPVRLLFETLMDFIFSPINKTEQLLTTSCEWLKILIDWIEGKRKEWVQPSVYTKSLALELLVGALTRSNIEDYKSKEMQNILNFQIIDLLIKLFNTNINNSTDYFIAVKLCRWSLVLIWKYKIGWEWIEFLIKYTLDKTNITWAKQIAIESWCKIIRSADLFELWYCKSKTILSDLFDCIKEISYDGVNLDNNLKLQKKYNMKNRKKSIDKDLWFNPITELPKQPYIDWKYLQNLTIELFENLQLCYRDIMEKKEILVNQLNFNLSPEQYQVRDLLAFKSDVIRESWGYLLMNSHRDEYTKIYLNIFQSLIGIFSSVSLSLIRDKYLNEWTNLCFLGVDGVSIKQKNIWICQCCLNISHCVNWWDGSSWEILFKTLEKINSLVKIIYKPEIVQEKIEIDEIIKNLNEKLSSYYTARNEGTKNEDNQKKVIDEEGKVIDNYDIIENNHFENYQDINTINDKSDSITWGQAKISSERIGSVINIECNDEEKQSEILILKNNPELSKLKISLDTLFIDSDKFNTDTLCNVTFSLCNIINKSIQKKDFYTGKEKHVDLHFYWVIIFEIIYLNVYQIELIFSQVVSTWEQIFELSVITVNGDKTQTESNLSSYALDFITAMIINILSKYEIKLETDPTYNRDWSKNNWQRTWFNPLMTISSQSLSQEMTIKTLNNLLKIIQLSCTKLEAFGWSSIFEICSVMINNNSEKTFNLLQQILKDYSNYLTPYNIIPILSLLGNFACYERNNNICFCSIELFWNCSDISEKLQNKYTQMSGESIQEICHQSIFYNEIWKNIFFKWNTINKDERKEVRKTGLNIFADIFISKIKNIDFENRITIIKDIFMKIFLTNIDKYTTIAKSIEDKEKVSEYEETLNTSILAMMKIIKAFLYEQTNDKEMEPKNQILNDFLVTNTNIIDDCTPDLLVQIWKSIRLLKVIDENKSIGNTYKIVFTNIPEFWAANIEITKYFNSDIFTKRYLNTYQSNKLSSEIIKYLSFFIINEDKLEGTSFQLKKNNNLEQVLSLLTIILQNCWINEKHSILVAPQKIWKIENEIFDFWGNWSIIWTDKEMLNTLYTYVFSCYYCYNLDDPHSITVLSKAITCLTLFYNNEYFDYWYHIKTYIDKSKKYLWFRNQSDIVDNIIKSIKTLNFFSIIASELNQVIRFIIPKSKEMKYRYVWEEIISCYETIFKQSENGYKMISRSNAEELIKTSQQWEIEILNWISDIWIPNSFWLDDKIQGKLLNLLDFGCNLNYQNTWSNSSTSMSKICILNWFELSKYKPLEKIKAEQIEKNQDITGENLHTYAEIKIKISKMCTPIWIKRCIEILKRFWDDELKWGTMPLSRTRLDEIKFVLESVKNLEIYPDETEDNKGKDTNIVRVLRKSKKRHLFYLHPILSQCITTKEGEWKSWIKDIFSEISMNMGISNESDIIMYSK